VPREQILMRHARAKPGIFDIGDFDLIQEMTTEDYSYWMPRPGKIAKDSLADLVGGIRSARRRAGLNAGQLHWDLEKQTDGSWLIHGDIWNTDQPAD